MYKISMVMMILFLNGCSYFKVTAPICDDINAKPTDNIPSECRAYDEKEAQKAFDKIDDNKKTSTKDIIEFEK